jgi:hypothetical protein
MRVSGEPERWLLAARLSRVAKKDRERGDELINGIQTQDFTARCGGSPPNAPTRNARTSSNG